MLPRFYYSAAAYISGEQMFNDVNQTHLVLDSGKLVVQKDGQTIWLKENLLFDFENFNFEKIHFWRKKFNKIFWSVNGEITMTLKMNLRV